MELIVHYYSLLYDVILFLAILYIWLFFLRRWNRYVAELRPFIRNATIFLGFGVVGRLLDIVTDFITFPHVDVVLAFLYGISIIGVIYTMVHYVLIFERYYLPPNAGSGSVDGKKLTGSYVLFIDKEGEGRIIGLLKELNTPALIFTRSPNSYSSLGENVVPVWITQATDKGIPPTKLHVFQERAIRFMRENPGSIIVLDDMDYLLMYNDFPTLFRFLVALKDYAAINSCTFVVAVSKKSVGDKERALLLNEFKPI
ncbi:DUF835 domain-containing protein [Thermococcus sp.]|uniref:DUF835 domain-containing protein n=1 Tax=Thermococcus sp. TaxID=35749 RepID=UPI0025DFA464|nr:DUF835 domain-containing protein [Thermococcus sp.]